MDCNLWTPPKRPRLLKAQEYASRNRAQPSADPTTAAVRFSFGFRFSNPVENLRLSERQMDHPAGTFRFSVRYRPPRAIPPEKLVTRLRLSGPDLPLSLRLIIGGCVVCAATLS